MHYADLRSTQKSQSINHSGSLIYYGLLLFFVFEYFNPTAFFPFLRAFHLNSIIPLSVFGFWLLSGQRESISAPQSTILISIALLILLSVFYALLTFDAYNRSKQFLGYLFIYFVLIHCVNSTERFWGILWVLLLIHALLALLNPNFLSDTTRTSSLTSGYFLGNGNDFALSVIILIPFSIFMFVTEKKIMKKLLLGGVTILLISIVVITESRASTVAFSVMLIYLLLKNTRKISGLIMLACITLGIVLFASQSYFKRIESIEHYQDDRTAQARLDAWEAGFQMAFDHPILGVGAGSFNSMYGRFYRPDDAISWRWISPHSTFIQCMAELGFLGLFLLLSLIICNFRDSRALSKTIKAQSLDQRLQSLPNCLETSLIGFCINGAFLGALYYPHLFVLTGLTITAKNIISKTELQPERDTGVTDNRLAKATSGLP